MGGTHLKSHPSLQHFSPSEGCSSSHLPSSRHSLSGSGGHSAGGGNIGHIPGLTVVGLGFAVVGDGVVFKDFTGMGGYASEITPIHATFQS